MAEKFNKYINIGCSANDNYAQHLGVMLYSMLDNCSCPEKIRIFVMDGNISQKNKEKLNSIVNHSKAKISYHKPDEKLIEGMKVCRHITLEAYYRFPLIENLNLTKLLYLDVDMVVTGDIKEIYNTPFQNNIVFAVKDPGGSPAKKRSLGIPSDKHYFNSGLLLVDCKRWREEKITQKALDFMRKNPEKIEHADQDGLNAVLVNKWEELNPCWNFIIKLFYHKHLPFLKAHGYEDVNLREISKNAKIIHYASFMKPWFFLDPIPYKKIYWKYLNETPWRNYKYPDLTLEGFAKRIFYFAKIFSKKFRGR